MMADDAGSFTFHEYSVCQKIYSTEVKLLVMAPSKGFEQNDISYRVVSSESLLTPSNQTWIGLYF